MPAHAFSSGHIFAWKSPHRFVSVDYRYLCFFCSDVYTVHSSRRILTLPLIPAIHPCPPLSSPFFPTLKRQLT